MSGVSLQGGGPPGTPSFRRSALAHRHAPAGEDARGWTVALDAVHRGRRRVLDASTLSLPHGTCVGVVGRNGAGKTSLLLALAGLLRRGGARSWGVSGPPASVALVLQHPRFPTGTRVRTIAAAHGVPPDVLAEAASGLLPHELLDRRTDELSGGQRQRLAVAIALARRDPLLLLDEPFANLDVPGRLALRRALVARQVRQPSLTVVVAAHAPADLHRSCDSLLLLAGGRVRQLAAAEAEVAGELPRFERRLAELLGASA